MYNSAHRKFENSLRKTTYQICNFSIRNESISKYNKVQINPENFEWNVLTCIKDFSWNYNLPTDERNRWKLCWNGRSSHQNPRSNTEHIHGRATKKWMGHGGTYDTHGTRSWNTRLHELRQEMQQSFHWRWSGIWRSGTIRNQQSKY